MIGWLGPGRRASFNVAIRTVVLDKSSHSAEYGVGGGVVWDSVGADEYAECLAKAKVLIESTPDFDLLETMLWTPGEGYFLKDKHLARLKRSADYFGFPVLLEDVEKRLFDLDGALGACRQRVRLLIGSNGGVRVETAPLGKETAGGLVRVALAREPVLSQNRFLYHKTTMRAAYNEAKASRPDCEDVVLFNERGEVTESTIANVVAEFDGVRITPPVESGLLPGVFREEMLERGEIKEGRLTIEDLRKADRIFLVNSVRKWRTAVMRERHG